MLHKNCGEPLRVDETVCAKCGTENNDAAESTSTTPKLRGFSSKKNVVIIALAGVLALGVGGTAVAYGVSNTPANRVSRYMGAAERYLSEMNYEQAIIEFQRILEIDPMNAEAYLGMAEAYVALGDIDNALETLRTGLEQTGDDRIRDKLNELLLSLALERGQTYLAERNYQQAESEFSDALGIDEKCVEAYIGKADSHVGEEDLDKAIEVLQKGFDLTGDNGIKTKLDELIEERSKPKLLWSEVDGNISYRSFGHYVKSDGDLWQHCDETGKHVSDKKYSYISNFVGTDSKNFALVQYEDGKLFSVDKSLNELSEFEVADHMWMMTNQENPLFLLYDTGRYNDDSDNAFLRIYSLDGTLLYSWNENECLDGSGNPAYIDDPMIPDELRQYIVELEEEKQRDYWCEKVETNLGHETIRNINSKLYISFEIDCSYDYDDSAERAAAEVEFQRQLQEYGVGAYAYNKGISSRFSSIIYCVSLENGKLKWERTDINSNNYIEYEGDDYRILFTFSPLAYTRYILDKAGETEKAAWFFRNTGYDPDFPLLNSFFDDQHMFFYKNKDDGSNERVYALYRIYWEDPNELPSFGDMKHEEVVEAIIELNKKHEQVTDFYDNIFWNDEMLEMGYLLVCKEDKWIYISIETGEELAIYDDASDFSNGYAVVTNNGKGCVIDSEFNVVSDEFPCTSASIIDDGSFTVTNGDEIKRLVIK